MNSEIVAMNILETAELTYKGKEYTISLAQPKNDSTKYAYFVQNNASDKNTKYEFSDNGSQDFKFYTGESLFEYLPEQIKSDIEDDII
jgi:hypothetical protein